MALRQQTTRHVHRDLPVTPRAALVDELAGTAGLAQAQVVVVQQLGGREAVVQLDEVEILRVDTGLLVGLVGRGHAGQRVDIGLHLATLGVRVRRHHRRADLHRPLLLLLREGAEPLLGYEHRGGRAVARRAAHEQRVRIPDHLRAHDLLETERLLVLRQWVQRRVRVVLLGHLGELLEGRRRRSRRRTPCRPARTRRA